MTKRWQEVYKRRIFVDKQSKKWFKKPVRASIVVFMCLWKEDIMWHLGVSLRSHPIRWVLDCGCSFNAEFLSCVSWYVSWKTCTCFKVKRKLMQYAVYQQIFWLIDGKQRFVMFTNGSIFCETILLMSFSSWSFTLRKVIHCVQSWYCCWPAFTSYFS